RGHLVALGQVDREGVEYDVHCARRLGTCRGSTRSLRSSEHAAGAIEITRPKRREECLQVCFAREGGVEWCEASGGAEQQPGRVAASLLLQGDLPAQVFSFGRRVGVELRSLECDEKPKRGFEGPGIPLR